MFPPPKFKKYLNGLGIQVDVLDSVRRAFSFALGTCPGVRNIPDFPTGFYVAKRGVDVQFAVGGGAARRGRAVPRLSAGRADWYDVGQASAII